MAPTTNYQPTNQVWQLVVHRPMLELDFLVRYLEDNCTKFIGNQHDADEDVNRTHCHFMLVNLNVSDESLRKCLKKNGIFGSDNYGLLKKCFKKKTDYNEELLAVYVLKGATECTQRGYDHEQLTTFANAWVDHDEPVNTTTNIRSARERARKSESLWEEILEEFKKDFKAPSMAVADDVLVYVRKWVMRWFFRKTGRLPHASVYKQYSGSLFFYYNSSDITRTEDACLDALISWY